MLLNNGPEIENIHKVSPLKEPSFSAVLLRKTDGWTRVCDNSSKLKQIVSPRICMERAKVRTAKQRYKMVHKEIEISTSFV